MRRTLFYTGSVSFFALLGLGFSWLNAEVDVTKPNQGREVNVWWGLGGAFLGVLAFGTLECAADCCVRYISRPEFNWIEDETKRAKRNKENLTNFLGMLNK